ncbi:n-acetylmuramoyl-L-alanine amidase [Clostridium sp. CAG:470]|nr:n-acetylmuramoyl-L-alanine amidase [Clostridium sp. CAG:470]
MLVTKVIMPTSKYAIKCPYLMNPEGISIHNTANDASAMSEISYMINNNNKVSFHEAIDDYRVVIGIEHNRNSWNAGDGHGFGNMKTISIEICYSKSGGERFEKAERNAAERIAYLMKQYGWNLDNITDTRHTIGTHQNRSGKYCPHRTLDMGLERFYNMIREEYRELTGETAQGTPNIVVDEKNNNTGRNIGDIVQINGVYTSSSSTKKLTPTTKSGMITRIIPGAKNPYLLNNGNIGWVNDSCIISSGSSQAQDNNTNATPNISVGSTVTLSASATNYATGQKIPNSFKNRNYTIMQVGNGKVLLKELYSWVYTKDLVGYTTSSVNSVSNSNFVLGLYVVNTTSGLNVRSGPGTNYEIKKTYANGTRFDTYEVKGDWARTPSGWVNLKYCKLVRKY